MHSLFETPIQTGVLLPKYQTNFYDEFVNKNPGDLFNSEKVENNDSDKIIEKNSDTNTNKGMEKARPSNLGLTSSNPFFFDSKNFSNKLFIVNITFDYDTDFNVFKTNFERLKMNLEICLKKFSLNLSNVLFTVSFLESSLDQLTFEKLFNYANNNYVKELSENYPLISPIYFSLCKYKGETNLNSGFNSDDKILRESSKSCDFLLLHKNDLNIFSSQKVFFTSILPCIKEVNNEQIMIISLDSKTYIGDNSLEQMILELSSSIEDSTNPFNNNIIAVQANYNNSLITKELQADDFFLGVKEFEELENSSYNLCRNNITNSGIKLDNRFFIMKILLKELMHLEEYFIEHSTLLDYSNINLHNLCFAKFLTQKLSDRDNKPYEIITSETAEFCTIYQKFHHTDWIDSNAKISAEYLVRGFNGLFNFYKINFGIGNLYGIYEFLKAFFFFCMPGMITMVLFIIFSIGFNHYYPAYGFMALFPFIYVLTLLMSLMGDYKLMRIFFFIINAFVIIYYIFAEIVAIVALDKLNKNPTIYNYKKGSFIGLFVYNGLIAAIPYFLNYNKFLNTRNIINALKFVLFYPTFSSLMPILSLNHIFSNRAVVLKSNLTIIFLLSNFLFSMLVYTIHSTGNVEYLLALAIMGTILFTIKILLILANFLLSKLKPKRQDEISNSIIQKYFSNQIVIDNNNIFEKGVKLNDKNEKKENPYSKPKLQNRLDKIDYEIDDIENDRHNDNLQHVTKKENVTLKNIEGHFNDDEKHIEIDDDEGFVYGNDVDVNNRNEKSNTHTKSKNDQNQKHNNNQEDHYDDSHNNNNKNEYYDQNNNNNYYDDQKYNESHHYENEVHNDENNEENYENHEHNENDKYNDDNINHEQDEEDEDGKYYETDNFNHENVDMNHSYNYANNEVEHANDNDNDHHEDYNENVHNQSNEKENDYNYNYNHNHNPTKNKDKNVDLEDIDFDNI